MAVMDYIRRLADNKANSSEDLLHRAAEAIQNRAHDRGTVAELLDLSAALTGYMDAPIPGGEARAAYTLYSSLLRYMILRARPQDVNGSVDGEIEAVLTSMISQCADLFSECTFNRAPEEPKQEGQTNG